MSDSKKSYQRAFHEMKSYFETLYEEADPGSGMGELPDAEVAPMYEALVQIDKRYENLELIGKGGMKEVYQVFDVRAARHVAMAKPAEKLSKDYYDAFLREAHLTARLEHPCIINLFDMGIDEEGRPFFTMELKRGRSLRKILRDHKKGVEVELFPLGKRLSIFLRICEALAYAHSRRVLHLDIKPENVQVGTFGEVQVCDWGMGVVMPLRDEEVDDSDVLLDPDLYGPLLDHARGTPGYMAPEQRDSHAPKTPQMDIYALGCLLQELVTLESPERQDANEDVPDAAMRAIIDKARHENSAARYSTVETLYQDIIRYRGGYSTSVEHAGFLREARLFYGRNRVPCRISFYFTVLLIGTGIWFTHQLRDEYQKTEKALVQSEEALAVTEEALAKYERGKELSSALLERQSEDVTEGALLLLDHLLMDETITLAVIENVMAELDKALATDLPPDDRIWSLKAYTLFLTQRFAEAEPFYAVRVGDQAELRAMIPEYASMIGQDGLLPAEDFIRLISRIAELEQNRAPLIERMMMYDYLMRDSLSEKTRILKAVLQLSNPEWIDPVFGFDPHRGHLHIGGFGLRSLLRRGAPDPYYPVPNLCLLRMLNIRSLDIKETELDDLNHLDGLKLLRLDIRRTAVTDLTPLTGMSSLRELIVEPDQFGAEQLAVLPETIAVTSELLSR